MDGPTSKATREASAASDLGQRPLAPWVYSSDELVELEIEHLFRPSWQFVCHASQVAAPRDYVTFDLCRDPVLVVRGDDGTLRAFLNVCRHRGTKVIDGAGRCRGRMTCPYHGWTYDLKGGLVGRPAEETFAGGSREGLALRPIELETFLGLVFVRIVPGGPSLAEMWKEYVPLLAPYRIEEMVPYGEAGVETWNCNWKVGVDNNLENYHVPIGHPGYNRILDSDMKGFGNEHGIGGSVSVLRESPLSNRWSERLYQQLAPRLNADLPSSVHNRWLFFTMPPNVGLDVYGDTVDLFQFFPRSGRSCTVRYPIFVRPGASREMKVLRYLNFRVNRQVSAEDRALSERVQLGLDSSAFAFGPFSDWEHFLLDFHARVRAALPVAGLPAPPSDGTLRQVNERLLRG